VVARDGEGRVVGSNFLDQRGEVASVGALLTREFGRFESSFC
jgi:hypothetical protein